VVLVIALLIVLSSNGTSSSTSGVSLTSSTLPVGIPTTISNPNKYVILGVCGTLQDGFPLRPNLDYTDPATGIKYPALFLGWGLIRGLKQYLDIKLPPAREFVPEPGLAAINPANVATGNRLDATQYAIYLVDDRACMHALAREPRYLAMAPDLTQVDLTAEETSDSIKQLFRYKLHNTPDVTDMNKASIVTVVGAYTGASFVEAPLLYTKPDGTCVTSFAGSLGLWIGLDPSLVGTQQWTDAVEKKTRDTIALFDPDKDGDDFYGVNVGTARFTDDQSADDFNDWAKSAGLPDLVVPDPIQTK